MNWKVENFLYQILKKEIETMLQKKNVDNYLEQLVFGAFEN